MSQSRPMRRADRAMQQEEALSFLQECSFGVLAMVDAEYPYAIPLNHFYSNGYLYFHSASTGRKIDLMQHNSHACFVVSEMQAIKPSPNDLYCGLGAYYRSVICEGEISLLQDNQAKADIVTSLARHLAPDHSHAAPTVQPHEVANLAIISFRITSISGKACLPN